MSLFRITGIAEMNKHLIIILLMSIGMMLPGRGAYSQKNPQLEVSATAMLSIVVVVPISAQESNQLNFGRFYPGASGGTITISPGGFVNTTSDVVIAASAPSAGSFVVSGQGDATYAINLPKGPAILTNMDGSKTMLVDGWVTDPVNGDAKVRLVGGLQTVRLGATLRVGSLNDNPKGLYTGSYEITFSYN